MDGLCDCFNIPAIFLHLHETKDFQNVQREMETQPAIKTIKLMKERGWFKVIKG